MNPEFKQKLARVRAVLKTQKAGAALLGRQSNFSWLACGGEAHVALISERAAGQWLVTPSAVYLLANRIEMPRLQAEAVAGLGARPLLFEWHQGDGAVRALKKIIDPGKVLSDTGELGTRGAPELFAPLRYALQPAEIKRARALAQTAAAAMREACHALQPGRTEFQLAGQLAEACWQRHITPAVLLVAVDERIKLYRHPLPTAKKLKRLAMLVLCARQNGLIVSITRLVHFGKLPADLRRRHEAVCSVDAAFIAHTLVGAPVREIFRHGMNAYAAAGFPEEWRRHHQGGPCGYQPREYVGTPVVEGGVLEHQAFAWNPSIAGTKSEDTILATRRGPEVLTTIEDWPMLAAECEGISLPRPDILVR